MQRRGEMRVSSSTLSVKLNPEPNTQLAEHREKIWFLQPRANEHLEWEGLKILRSFPPFLSLHPLPSAIARPPFNPPHLQFVKLMQ